MNRARKDEGVLQPSRPDVQQFKLRLPLAQYESLKAMAFFTSTSMNELIVRAVGELIDGTGGEEQFTTMLQKVRTDYRSTLDKLKHL
jgi:hypothetical protein